MEISIPQQVGTHLQLEEEQVRRQLAYLNRLIEAGFESRIMFGSDNVIWPDAIPIAIQSIKDAPFLTSEQKRDILYNNAARFLRLTPQQIQSHAKLGN